ncbi:MAG TPA: histidine kinase dimerization/phosphoacceptor domain -containing protein [Caulobacteraceae bacterium]|nr:histidine kinase dimerization/phosphoacceptor domain -containing protein [Caulobacteraceae bacterium]
MNHFREGVPDTAERTRSEKHIEDVRQRGGLFVDAVRLTRMPMLVTDATLPGNPVTFANKAFLELSGYSTEELLGQDPHFMNGPDTDPDAVRSYEAAMRAGRDVHLELVQYRKDRSPFHAMLFASPLDDGQGRVISHFLSYLDVSRRYEAEQDLKTLSEELEQRVAARTAELEAANARLTDLVAERDMLLMEVNHRAKNSLSVAAAMLSIQARRQAEPDVRALFEDARDRLNAMARVHDMLSKSEASQRVDLTRYLTDLCEALRTLTDTDGRVRVRTAGDADLFVDADIAFPLGIVVTELFTNAVKYAFPAPRTGEISTEARRTGPDMIQVTFRDDGVGMGAVREGSLGYGLIAALVRQIGGTYALAEGPGVAVSISFETRRAEAQA